MPARSARPFILTVIDGEPTDDWRAGLNAVTSIPSGANAIRIGIAVGDGAPIDVLKEVGKDGVLRLDVPMEKSHFSRLFSWVSSAVSAVIKQSDAAARLELPPPPTTVL